MKKNIILAGVGGQGILSIATVIDLAAVKSELNIKQAEVHGMSQRGGAVQSHLRISDTAIYSDLIPLGQADLILSVEPMEALRHLPWLSENGMIVSSIDPVKNIPNYPDMEKITEQIRKTGQHLLVNAAALAAEIGNPKTANMIVLGAASPWTCIEENLIEEGVRLLFEPKGKEVADLNVKAFRKGRSLSEKSKVLK
ncbi:MULTISPECIES: indolepyruvate oxidoreductase subunit beta [Prosthecochloris]|uniref:Indolepyruvate oxidoreductase n=1 Tax=Prosthecochloris marina TaxID=2017681 RepID=A0A317T9H6_9CHLB|nr:MULTISPECIES: indolepyruvate oxidoreductase subunit beta [Prosthecochloris]PWW83362.1 indolepyruvate oxidoreductase [Prosthecochloris marina]UZJ36567.1 indolepyruvate oxidoreductase subunit beta [Prosthecochloris sp. SCSIO W1103]